MKAHAIESHTRRHDVVISFSDGHPAVRIVADDRCEVYSAEVPKKQGYGWEEIPTYLITTNASFMEMVECEISRICSEREVG